MQSDKVFFDIVSGWPKKIVTTILRKLSAYTRQDRVDYFKIGITNNPKRRFQEEHKYNYDEMIVLYKSKSIDNVSELEDELIEHNRDLADNIIAGGGGNIGNPPYFMYVVLKHL
jgi:hypothetical protein